MSKKNQFNKNPIAVALAYDPDIDHAPKVLASGKGLIATQIINLAKEHGIHTHVDEGLSMLLSKIEANTIIPIEAYGVVAEIISSIHKFSKINNQKQLK